MERKIKHQKTSFLIKLTSLSSDRYNLNISKDNVEVLTLKTDFIDIDNNKDLFQIIADCPECEELAYELSLKINKKLLEEELKTRLSKQENKTQKKDWV
ncbi:MAG: hypothetical protein R3Y43_08120 [Alphaproteobacteria bacterium]